MAGESKKNYETVNAGSGLDDKRTGNKNEEDLFSFEEITIEEMAIDGICGVY